MTSYILKRIILGILTLFIIIVLVYLLVSTFKGVPPYHGPIATKGVDPYKQWLEHNNFDKPPIVRLWIYISNLFKGNFGKIYDTKSAAYSSVVALTFNPMKYTMMVMLPAYFVGMVFGIFVGFVAGYNRGRTIDTFIIAFVVLFIAIPSFLVASYALILAPILGLPTTFINFQTPGFGIPDMLKSLIIPIVVVSLTNIASWTYYIRNEVSLIRKSDFIISARSRGFSEFLIFRRYVWRNAIYPISGMLAVSFMVVFTSSIIIERVFNVPGTSNTITYAVKNGEINVLMFQVIFFGSLNIFLEIFADFVRFMVSPQIMASFKSSISPLTIVKNFFHRTKIMEKERI